MVIDAAFIEKCADPSLTPAIVEQFVATAGSDDPLAIAITIGGRVVLVPKPADAAAAVEMIRGYVGQASVRVGITQLPAGVGISDPSQLAPQMFDACTNLRMGTTLFAKVARIVTQWYGRPTNTDLLPQMVDDAIHAWRTGFFEGVRVFGSDDPGGPTLIKPKSRGVHGPADEDDPSSSVAPTEREPNEKEPGQAGIRVDLSRIGVR
jgi:hypothetical protein